MRARSLIPAVLALFALPVALTSCSQKQRIHTEKEIAKALISNEQEQQIGLAVKSELNKQGVRLLEDPDVQAYVDAIGAKVFRHAKKEREGVDYHLHVVANDEQVNAFATPGGHLYVTTGLLLTAEDEAEVAGVIAHEAGHVVARHSARQLVNLFGLQAVTSLALGENPRMLEALAANVVATGLLLAHSRSDEHEADRYGVIYAAKAGYDPRGIQRFFKKLKAKEGNTPRMLTWLATHPATKDRIENVEELIHDKKLTGGQRNESRHAAVKEILQEERHPVRGTEPVH